MFMKYVPLSVIWNRHLTTEEGASWFSSPQFRHLCPYHHMIQDFSLIKHQVGGKYMSKIQHTRLRRLHRGRIRKRQHRRRLATPVHNFAIPHSPNPNVANQLPCIRI